ALMAATHSYVGLVIGYAWVQFFFNAAGAAFAGIIPDVVPAQQFGRASGFLATTVQLGSGGGLFTYCLFHGPPEGKWVYFAFALVILATLIPTSLAAAGEGSAPLPPREPQPFAALAREFVRPLFGGDFAWVILTRFFVSAGIVTVASYLLN